MGIHVNGPNHILAHKLAGNSQVGKADFLNTIFGYNHPKFVPNTQFSGENQHVLGLFANAQDNVMIED